MAEHIPQPPSKPFPIRPLAPKGMKIETPLLDPRVETLKTNHGNVGVLSPVNQNGSFEFDRVIKSGMVLKRTRKTKSWKPIYLVLRPNLLSIYKDKAETRLRHQITLSEEITAVARQKDSKKKMDHVFGLFSPSRNYHLGASSEQDAQEWVEAIRREARIDEEEEEMILMSPSGNKNTFMGFDRAKREHLGSSSSEAEPRPSTSIAPENMHSARRTSHTVNYSGNDMGSLSDFSDTGGALHTALQSSSISLPRDSHPQNRNVSQGSNIGATPDDERVIYHGWLYVLKSKGGVRQWKKVWVVLRPKTLGLYKNEEEYSANLIIPFSSIINAVDIDPVSKSKKYCIQIISEEKNFRFCAESEDSLAKWLGALKSLLVKRKEAEQPRVIATTPNAPGAQQHAQQAAAPKPRSTSGQQPLQGVPTTATNGSQQQHIQQPTASKTRSASEQRPLQGTTAATTSSAQPQNSQNQK
ncbi:PH domain-like protein [Lindgomyces ingoldianus]|uniref:PH domain-like protein n=1 Tax=Lindgomyces ingoldianus TaxID=673940 RepID=A0ACB6QHZ4_9PLEO|nr:PH domain-like protein [Lindgomyces ingoldianus]KAF2466120.1 PH domain-like protein [Lindgomyces ingoldianus]